jgi:hypothetical protein
MSNDGQTATGTVSFSPQKQMPQSPWKRPNRVSLSKAKSIKRKSELMFGSAANCSLNDSSALNSSDSSFRFDSNENNPDGSESQQHPQLAKTRKTLFNRFSINTSLNLSYGFGSNSSNVAENSNTSCDNSRLDEVILLMIYQKSYVNV